MNEHEHLWSAVECIGCPKASSPQLLIKEAISKNNSELVEAIEKLLPADYMADEWSAAENYILGKVIDLIKQKTNE